MLGNVPTYKRHAPLDAVQDMKWDNTFVRELPGDKEVANTLRQARHAALLPCGSAAAGTTTTAAAEPRYHEHALHLFILTIISTVNCRVPPSCCAVRLRMRCFHVLLQHQLQASPAVSHSAPLPRRCLTLSRESANALSLRSSCRVQRRCLAGERTHTHARTQVHKPNATISRTCTQCVVSCLWYSSPHQSVTLLNLLHHPPSTPPPHTQ